MFALLRILPLGFVAGVTGTAGKRVVLVRPHHPGINRHMRVVAFTAIDFASVQVKMRRHEFRVIAVMADKTLTGDIFLQEGGKLRSMRRVTIETTAVGYRRMRLAVGQLFLKIGVAGKAEPFRFIQQKPRQGRQMRLMATGAGAVGNRPVNTCQPGSIRGHDIVAVGAHVFLFFRQ